MKNHLRYAVLDAEGVKINVILVDDPFPANYWPGYGRFIVCEFGEPAPTLPTDLDIRPGEDCPFSILSVRPLETFEMGDKMDLQTGAITRAEVISE